MSPKQRSDVNSKNIHTVDKTVPKGKVYAVFSPLLDWWVIVIVGIFIVTVLATIVLALSVETTIIYKIVITAVCLFFALYLIDLTFFTKYCLTDDSLLISNQFRHYEFPYRHMTKIVPGGVTSFFSRGSFKRFSLSSKNLVVYLKGDHWKRISVSPYHGDLFLNTLMDQIDKERSKRVSQ